MHRIELYIIFLVVIVLVILGLIRPIVNSFTSKITIEPFTLDQPITIEVKSTYKFEAINGINFKKYKDVGVTYYAKGEPTVPGVTMFSGRHVYEGAIAISRDMLGKLASPGDLVWVASSNRWYKVEDLMSAQYTMRVDIFTHDMVLAGSGSSKSDILIMRSPIK